jgi:rhamnosyltransferase
MNICGVVILYYPDSNVVERVKSYQKALEHLYLIDNSNTNNKELLASLLPGTNVTYLHDSDNKGIAKRLNEAAKLALAAGYRWLLTMDQDSYFGPEVVNRYLSCIDQYENKERVAMFGIKHNESLHLQYQQCVYTKSTRLITSGSMVNINILLEINGFDEALFIDHVDHEYCFRSILLGYEIVRCENILLYHAIGNPSLHRSLKSLQVTSRSLHTPIRMYYMVRNYLYIRDKYAIHFKKELRLFRKDLIVRFKNNLLYNKERAQVVTYIIRGYKDYKLNKMGKIGR